MVTQHFSAVAFQVTNNVGFGTDNGITWASMSGIGDFYPTPNSTLVDVDNALPHYQTVTVEDTDGITTHFQDESGLSGNNPTVAEQHKITVGGTAYNASPVYSYNVFNQSTGTLAGRAYLVIVDTDGVDNPNGTSAHQDWDAGDQYYMVFDFDLNTLAGSNLVLTPFGGDGTFAYSDTLYTPVCFAGDSHIQTPDGPRKADDLSIGDRVLNRDGEAIEIRWVGKRKFDLTDAPDDSKHRPVRITQGALGGGLPTADLTVSRQHRMLIKKGSHALPMDVDEALIAAIKLTELPGIYVDTEATEIEYVHLLFDRHEIIYAEGCETESLYTGPEALKAIPVIAVKEVLDLFPELKERDYKPEPAAYIPPNKMQKQIVAALAKAV